MQQLPYWGPKIIKCHRAKYFRPVDLTTGICALLMCDFRNVLIHTVNCGLLRIVMTEREKETEIEECFPSRLFQLLRLYRSDGRWIKYE